MKILVACEESQEVCIAFREKGHEAYSCDIKNCSGGHPEWHIKDDVLNHLKNWDMIIAFPPCTYFSRINFLNYYRGGKFNSERFKKAKKYISLFNAIYNAECDKICIENPVPMKIFDNILPKYTMTFQTYEFGANYSKKTCLWLKGLPPLIPTCQSPRQKALITTENSLKIYKNIEEQSTFRSKTYNGVARAMAQQWNF